MTTAERTEDVIAEKARTISDPSWGTRNGRVYVIATARTQTIGDQSPYFSLTGSVWKTQRAWMNGTDSANIGGGCIHEELLRHWPELAPIAALHLSDAHTGAPMHALANGWYFYSGKSHEYERRSSYSPDPTDTPHERTARHLRISEAELPTDLDEEEFTAFVASLDERWAKEAAEGRALLLSLRGGA